MPLQVPQMKAKYCFLCDVVTGTIAPFVKQEHVEQKCDCILLYFMFIIIIPTKTPPSK